MKSILVALVVLTSSIAWADTGSGSGSDTAAPAPPPACVIDAKAVRKNCVDAMNADKTFAVDIVKKADAVAQQTRDDATVAAHQTAANEIAVNQRHVILAYAAMWIIAALFVIFLWRRQRGLVAEIAQLRADLTRATAEEPGAKKS
jgi:hypothetical protein